MERVNQRTNNLVGTNIRKLRIQRKLRSIDVVAKLQLHGVEITTSTFCKVERGLTAREARAQNPNLHCP